MPNLSRSALQPTLYCQNFKIRAATFKAMLKWAYANQCHGCLLVSTQLLHYLLPLRELICISCTRCSYCPHLLGPVWPFHKFSLG